MSLNLHKWIAGWFGSKPLKRQMGVDKAVRKFVAALDSVVFTAREVSACIPLETGADFKYVTVRSVLYRMHKQGLIVQAGKDGREIRYRLKEVANDSTMEVRPQPAADGTVL